VPWPEDGGVSRSFHLKTRDIPMSETPNDYIRRVKAFSTFPGRPRYAHHVACPVDLLTPLGPEEDTPK